MSLNCRLSNHNNTSNNLMKRQSSTSSHSYDDLSDQFDSLGNNSNRLACSRNGYAKILPRSKAAMSGGGGAQDMWAVKASGQAAISGDLLNSGSLVMPRYFFPAGAAAPALGYACNTVGGGRHSFGGPVFGGGGGENLSERHHGTARSAAAGSSNSAPSGKKRNNNKYHKIGPRTLNPPPRGIPPYALVPVRICDRVGRGEEGEGEGEHETISAPWERGTSAGFAINKPVPSHHQLNGGHGLASPAQVLSLQTSAVGLHAASGPKASAIDGGGGSGGNDIFMSLRRLTKSGKTAARHSGASSCSGGSSSTTTTATAAELSRLHQAAPLGGGGRTVADCGGDVLEDDAFSNDDYVDMTSDAGDDDEGEESVDENYKALTDRALDHLVV